MPARGLKGSARRAFTLIEMLTVVAITAVLLSLVIIPVVQGFNLTRQAQALADAQEKARRVIERVSREVGNAAAIRDNTGNRGTVAVIVPGRLYDANGQVFLHLIEYAKLDLVRPAEGDPTRGASGALVNPNIGKEDPTLEAAKGQMILPVTPGDTIVRYFIGLRDPFGPRGYNNPYEGILMARNADRDNLFVLWRVEARPFVWDVVNSRYVVNTQLFEVDPASVVPSDPFSGLPILDDPYFFLRDRDRFGNVLAGAALVAKEERVRRWMKRGTIVTEVSRYDMIQPMFDKRTRLAVYDGDVARILPLVQFRPTAVGNEPVEGMAAVRLTTESDNMVQFAPDVFRTKFGGWSSLVVRAWPNGWDRFNPAANEYIVARAEQTAQGERLSVFLFDPDVNANELTDGTRLFDTTTYDWALKNNLLYPFSRALDSASLASQYNRDRLLAMAPVPGIGKMATSFPIEEVGNFNAFPPPGGNAPLVLTGPALTPLQDPNPPGTIFDPVYTPSNMAYEVNSAFNKIWATRPELRPNIHRFIDLRVARLGDGTPSPLHPIPTLGFSRARIVPGSEVVVGPDQYPGPHYGLPIRYHRTTRNPGPNQYKINYADLPEPTDYRLLGFVDPEVSTFEALGGAYSATNFLAAHIQPRYKSGYIQLYSDPNAPLPSGDYRVTYRFQFSRAGDTFAVDYDSRQLITVLLTIRNYAQSTLPTATGITVKGTATARNILR